MKKSAIAAALALAQAKNMNGDYIITTGNKMGATWNDDYASKVRS